MEKKTLIHGRMDKEEGECSLARSKHLRIVESPKGIILISHCRLDSDVDYDRCSSEDHMVDELDNI